MSSIAEPSRFFTLSSRRLWLVFIAVFAISIVFAFYTDHSWEDYYITYRAAKNLAMGQGLVFSIGERLQTFTSPLGALIPAFLSFMTGNSSDELVIWIYRVMGCSLLGLSAVMLIRIAQNVGLFAFPAFLLIGLFAVDDKIIDFSINGQETALMMFFLVSTLYLFTVRTKLFILKLGLSWAGLMWTRPDSFVYFGGLALGYLIFNPVSPHFSSRSEMFKKFGLAAVAAAAVYAPWVLWAWYYYGTPVPHTVVAKGLFMPAPNLELLTMACTFIITAMEGTIVQTFLPMAYMFGGWPVELIDVYKFLAVICSYYWCLPFGRREGRAVSFALFLSHFYLTSVNVYSPANGWYITNATLMGIFVISQIAQQGEDVAGRLQQLPHSETFRGMKATFRVFGGIMLLSSLLMTLASGYQLKLQHEIIDAGNRKNIGLWLKDHAASPKDRVFLECLGYIGFYSQMKMLDFPGLASPEVVEVRRKLNTDDYAPIIASLWPDWLVLRPHEISAIEEQIPSLLSTYYEQAKVFDVTEKINSYQYIPGRQYLEFDETFVVYRVKK